MVSQAKADKNHEFRRYILAPRIWPDSGGTDPTTAIDGEPIYYLSWPGWELYLTRRLGLGLSPDSRIRPLLINDPNDPEHDFLTIDQLVRRAGELGAGLLGLLAPEPESLPSLTETLRNYPENRLKPTRPHLDDRSFLALWSVAEFRLWEAEDILAKSRVQEQAMWAALKGRDIEDDEEDLMPIPPQAAPDPARRSSQLAWQCWHRLAAPLLTPDYIIMPTVPETGEDD